jgi:hypothetical protein
LSSTKCCQDPADLPCPEPCGKPLAECLHPCTCTCGKCRQGRLHQDCAQDCQRILICGHPCREKCAKVCPPCSRPCETACKHNKCCKKAKNKNAKKQGRTCGDRCPPCAEKCANKCLHRRCTMKCSEPCNVERCEEPCTKPLPCSIDGPKPAKGIVGDIKYYTFLRWGKNWLKRKRKKWFTIWSEFPFEIRNRNFLKSLLKVSW